MINVVYSKISVEEYEKSYIARFIEALRCEVREGKHSYHTNNQVFWPGIFLLENRHSLLRDLTLEQIVRGILNMTLHMENKEYEILHETYLSTKFQQYVTEAKRWCGDYYEQVAKKMAAKEGKPYGMPFNEYNLLALLLLNVPQGGLCL